MILTIVSYALWFVVLLDALAFLVVVLPVKRDRPFVQVNVPVDQVWSVIKTIGLVFLLWMYIRSSM